MESLPALNMPPSIIPFEKLLEGSTKSDEQAEGEPTPTAPTWPADMESAAYHGLAGDVVRTIEPHSEADPVAILMAFLACFGNMIGASAHWLAEATKHTARIWPVLVGQTAYSRKGSAVNNVRYILSHIDEDWLARCVKSGLSSGEGLIWAVRDPIIKKGETVDEGVLDKRLLTIEEEFSSVLKVGARDGNIVSDLLRRAWDHGNLQTMTKNSPACATGAHISVLGNITQADLRTLLSTCDSFNGFANRFLWVAVKRSKSLPDGGKLHEQDITELVNGIQNARDFAQRAPLLERTDAARKLWHEVYPALTTDRGGLLGAITSRAEAQVMRLALIYALLDQRREIDIQHLQAALAVWNYCERSARFIFGDSLGDRVADRIRVELRKAGSNGLTKTAIHELLDRNESAQSINAAIDLLIGLKLAEKVEQPSRGKGRPPVVYKDTAYVKNELNENQPGPVGIHSFNTSVGPIAPDEVMGP